MKRKKWHEHTVSWYHLVLLRHDKKIEKSLQVNAGMVQIALQGSTSTVDRWMWPNNVRSTYTPASPTTNTIVGLAGHTHLMTH